MTRKVRIASNSRTQRLERALRRCAARLSCTAPCSSVATSVKRFPSGGCLALVIAPNRYSTRLLGGPQFMNCRLEPVDGGGRPMGTDGSTDLQEIKSC